MSRWRLGLGGLGVTLALWSSHCGYSDDASDSSGSAGLGGGWAGTSGAAGTGGSGVADSGVGGGAGATAPERELESSFLSPIATGKYVWAANPESGRVALVDAVSYEVRLAEAGDGPTYLAAVPDPDGNAAIVLNARSHDATLFRVDASGALTQLTLETHRGANAWAISPSGRWAIAWTDARRVERADPTDGFQDITVLELTPERERSRILSVGYRPSSIAFAEGERRAFAVTEPGVSVLELEGAAPRVSELVALSDAPLVDTASYDVSITPSGAWALVRQDGSRDVGFVSLETGARVAVPLSGSVTDLDLSADGARAVAVVRERSEVFVLPVPEATTAPERIESVRLQDATVGSVALSYDSSVALLYTNAVESDRLGIVTLSSGPEHLAQRVVAMRAPVSAVFPAPDARHAIVLQGVPSGSAKAGAFSVLSTAQALSPKLVGTDAPPQAVAFQPGALSEHALITVRGDARRQYGVYHVWLGAQQVDYEPLASPPLAAGVVAAANKGYVVQLHPEGRITFIGFDTGEVRTLTGFELGAKVVE